MKKRGFTLAELVITMAVSGIVLVSVFTMIASVTSYNHSRNDYMQSVDELNLTKSRIKDWFMAYDSVDYSAPTVGADGKTLSIDDTHKIVYTDNRLSVNDSVYTLEHITDISFAGGYETNPEGGSSKNLVKCTVTYKTEDSNGTYVFLLLRRSSPQTT